MKKLFLVMMVAVALTACNNSSNGADNAKDKLDSMASEKKDKIDSAADRAKDKVDSTVDSKKEAINKADSANRHDTTHKK